MLKSIISDVNALTSDPERIDWTQEDKDILEGQLVLLTSEPLCLDPSPCVAIMKSKLESHRYKMRNKSLKRLANRTSQVNLNWSTKYLEFHLDFPFHILKIRNNHLRENEYHHFADNALTKKTPLSFNIQVFELKF